VLDRLAAHGPASLEPLSGLVPPGRRQRLACGLAWLAKLDPVRVVERSRRPRPLRP
jgi:hypothetical protein